MAFSTKLNLSCAKFEQTDGTPLTLSGDTKIDAVGTICYTTDQSGTYTARSLVDAGYVTGKTTCGITTANNGLTKQGQNVKLGGALTGNTCVTLSGTQNLILGVPAGNRICINTGNTGLYNTQGNCATTVSVCPAQSQTQAADVVAGKIATFNANVAGAPFVCLAALCTSTSCAGQICLTPNAITINGGATFPGEQYSADFSANFTARSLVDKGFVTGLTTCGITTANNGLTKVGQNVVLGGTLTGATTLTAINGTSLLFTDSRTTPIGIQYGGDYSSAFTARSLVDAGYVTGKTCQGIICANNGLTKVGQNVIFGGLLTGSTNVFMPNNTYLGLGWSQLVGGSANGGRVIVCRNITTNDSCVNVATKGAAGCTEINVIQSGITVGSTASGFKGAVYASDYSANFVDNSLITKKYVCSQTSGITSGYLCCANNGLTKDGQNVRLGGALTGNTTIDGAGSYSMKFNALDDFNVKSQTLKVTGATGICLNTTACSACLTLSNAVTGSATLKAGSDSVRLNDADALAYLGDYSACYKCLSIPNVGYVTGITCNIACKVDKCVASVGEIIYRDATQLTGCCNMYYCDSLPSVTFGRCQQATACDSGVFAGACSTAGSECSVVIGGNNNFIDANTARAVIIGSQNINISGATYLDTTVVGCLAIKCTPDTCVGDVLTYHAATGKITKTTLSSLGGLTGATNGLHTCGQDARLGGFLVECTHIEGNQCFDIDGVQGFNVRVTGNTDMNIDAQQCGGFTIKSQCGTCDTFGDFVDAVGFYGHFDQPQGFAIYDNRPGTGQTGIVYAGNYSTNYVNRSLVDKQYVDSVATGLNVHAAVLVATTGPITLSGNQLIDGIMTVNGDRVLVKDQGTGVTGATTNGIYDANSGAWTRSSDYDGTPSGEVSNGDLIPVTSGLTQNNTLFAQTALNPITVGVTPLIFSLFATVIDLQAGVGIAITQLGGVHTVCVDLASNCGLTFCGNGLAVNPLIAGTGLTYTNGVLDVNIAAGGAASSISVKRNAGNCLVVNCADINTALNAVTGATNGLTKVGQVVVLGGTLTGDTTICGNDDFNMNFTCLCDFNLGFGAGTGVATITDTNGTPKGLQYAADYSASFVDESLVTKYFVDNAITGSTLCFNNGLTKAGNTISLGGSLTGNTSIDVATYELHLCSASAGGVLCSQLGDGTNNGTFCLSAQGACLTANDVTDGTCGEIALGGIAGGAVRISANDCVHIDVATGGACYDFTATELLIKSAVATYDGDYSPFTARQIPDAAWVTGITCQGITTANNGLTKYGQNIVLGGSLTGDTKIDIACHTFIVCGAIGSPFIQIYEPTCATSCHIISSCACTSVCGLGTGGVDICAGGNLGIGFCGTGIVTDSSGNGLGLQYATNYSATFVPLSLVTKQYVDNELTGGTGIAFAGNGLTKVNGNTVILGGTLTGNTAIDISTHYFTICGPLGNSLLAMCDAANVVVLKSSGTTTVKSDGLFGSANLGDSATYNTSMCSTNAAAISTAQLSLDFSTSGTVTDTSGSPKGLINGGDYEANFIARSLVTAQYVTGITTCGITTANNGLTKVGSNVVLGGPLTGNTCVGITDTNGLYVTGGTTCTNWGLLVDAGNVTLGDIVGNYGSSSYITVGADVEIFNRVASNAITICNSGANGNIDISSLSGKVNLTASGVTLQATPPAGTTSDSVIVWNSTDKQLKTVSGAALGDKNNIYAKTVQSVSTTLTSGSTYVQLINPTSGTTITLPAVPKDGQAFKLKDVSGTALTNNILVVGNAGDIDGSASALINTDFGALELMWDESLGEWYSLAFVN